MRCNEISRSLPRFICCSGDNQRQLFKTHIARDGSIKLIPAGFQDTDQFIESFRESVELSTLIARFENGDTSALDQKVTFFGDQMDMPDNLAQCFEIFKVAEGAFDYLSAEDKALYGNDFMKWIQDYGSEQFMKTISEKEPKSAFANEATADPGVDPIKESDQK